MNILFLCHQLTGGGAERVCADVANGLSRLGHKVAIMMDTSIAIVYPVLPDVQIYSCPERKGNSWIMYRIKIFWKILEVLKKYKPDVIVSILYFHATLAKLASMLVHKCPVIVSDHNSFERPESAPFPLNQKIDKFFRNYYFDYLTVLTQADYTFLNGRFKKVVVMPNPLTWEPEKVIPSKSKIILAVGRVDIWYCKGFDILLKAWSNLACFYPDWTLRLVGAGHKKNVDYLKSLVHNISNVEFVPYTKEIKTEYRDAEIFVLSSRYEGFGLVLTEAMSQGCACIACDYNGRQSEIVINNKTGLICGIDNLLELEQKLKILLDNNELRKRLQHNALHALDRYKVDHISKLWEQLLHKCIYE